MDRSRFNHYLSQIDTLTAGQRKRLLAALKNSGHATAIPSQVRECERRLDADRTCTRLARMRHRTKWTPFQVCLRQRTNLYEAVRRCGISMSQRSVGATACPSSTAQAWRPAWLARLIIGFATRDDRDSERW